ncbi:hypothetical protein SAMN05216389_101116 [Oceanobacillus limi]|uniref:Uncharacterized protein n=1 Tax=Oceanobacillus limi TaxID=930131 RepID=A0A1H9Y180_9BACI|nr:hypothetical protein [Oceanobacillus limi]SES62521.1 hypothetical protein SAMN05216389_101116 [Oceanobacillus limi]
MKKRFIFLLLIFVLLLSACNNSDGLFGKTFDVSVRSSLNNPEKFDAIMTLEFSDGNLVKNTRGYEEGTYEWKEDELVLLSENENENLEFIFTVKESDKEFSKYSAVISDIVYEMTNPDKISHLQNLFSKFDKERTYEFITK